MKLGANSVLFGGHNMETAFKYIAMAGYDGIELSAIDGMSEHLVLNHWHELAPEIKRLSKNYDLELLAMEQPIPRRLRHGASLSSERRNRDSNCQLRSGRHIR